MSWCGCKSQLCRIHFEKLCTPGAQTAWCKFFTLQTRKLLVCCYPAGDTSSLVPPCSTQCLYVCPGQLRAIDAPPLSLSSLQEDRIPELPEVFCSALHFREEAAYVSFFLLPPASFYTVKKKKNLIIRSKEVSQFLLITIQILTSESKIKCFVTFSLCLLSLNALMFWIKEKMEKVYGELHCLRGCKQLSH